MGSGARAERMALGASLAEKKSYLAQLMAEKEDTGPVEETQQKRIQTLDDRMSPGGQIKSIARSVEPKTKKDITVPVIAAVIAWFILGKKK